jgi:VWFA-related protein
MSRRIALLAAILATSVASSPRAQQPTFKSGVDLIRLDVNVVSDDGTPVKDLTPDDFDVKVNGKPAPVRALQFLDFARTERTASEQARYRDVSTNQESLRGRLTILVIDESSLPEDTRPLMNSLAKYLKTLGPDDLTALIALPRPGLWHDFTRNTAELEALLLRTSTRIALDQSKPFPSGATATSGSVAIDRGEVPVPNGVEPASATLDQSIAQRRARHLLRYADPGPPPEDGGRSKDTDPRFVRSASEHRARRLSRLRQGRRRRPADDLRAQASHVSGVRHRQRQCIGPAI